MSAIEGKLQELWKRLGFTLLMLAIYRLATQVPTPGVDGEALSAFFEGAQGSIFGIFNTFSGGALQRFSILALGIMPYITTSIIFSLLTVSIPQLAELQKEPDGHKKINQWTRYATVILCMVQGYMLAIGLESVQGQAGSNIVINPGWTFRFLTVVSMTGGTMFLMWLGEQITERGIGNGISLIIFAGIAAGIIPGAADTINLYQSGEMSGMILGIVLGIMLLAFWLIIYVERAFRKVPIHYAKRVVNNRVYGGQNSHLPIKVNVAGVMPPIFASALLGFPTTVKQFVSDEGKVGEIINIILGAMAPGQLLYSLVFVGLIVFFAYFYAQIQFKTEDLSENLRKNGGFVPGIRPGERTVEFLNKILDRLTFLGAIYLSVICILPTILFSYANVPFYFGGTSLLILVGVAIDTMGQVESFMISQRFDKAYKVRGKFKGARRF